MTSLGAVDRWAAQMRADGASAGTIDIRVRVILGATRHALAVAADCDAAAITPQGLTRADIESFVGRPGLAANTRASYYQHLNLWMTFCVDEGLIAENPLSKRRRRPRATRGMPRPLSDEEVTLLLATAEPDVLLPALLLGLREGLRSAEVVAVRGQSFAGPALVVIGKGGRRREVPVHPDIEALRWRMPRIGWWFPSPVRHGDPRSVDALRDRVTEHFRRCGIMQGTMHRARHTFATQLLEHDVDVRIVQELLGHTNLATTAIYTRVSRLQKAAAIAALPRVSGL